MNEKSISKPERVKVAAAGGEIHGSVWQPSADLIGAIVLHPATATPERFYTGFAEYAVARGFAVLTYDYRGTGASGVPKQNPGLRMRDWMSVDVPTMSALAKERFGDVPLYGVGHSIGGHAMVLGYGVSELERFAVVSAHVAATRTVAGRGERMRVAAVLHALGPLLSRTVGYMPGKKVGLGEDITAGAMIEWGRWARKPNYFFDDPSMNAVALAAGVKSDVLVIGSSDDPWASPAQVDALASFMTAASVQRRTYSPADLGARRVGHHGLLRRGVGEKAWADLLAWFTAPAA